MQLLPASNCTCLYFRCWPRFTDIHWDHLPKSSSTQTFLRSETPSYTYPGEIPFRETLSCFKVPLLLLEEAWHPGSVATRGREQPVYGQDVTALWPRSKPGCYYGPDISLARGAVCFHSVSGRDEMTRGRFPICSVPTTWERKQMLWCHVVCLSSIKCSISTLTSAQTVFG